MSEKLKRAVNNVRTMMNIDKRLGKVWVSMPVYDLELVVAGALSHLTCETEPAPSPDTDAEEWGVYEFATGVLWKCDPATREEAEKCAESFKDYGYHLPVPVVWGEHMRNASAHGRARGLKERMNQK